MIPPIYSNIESTIVSASTPSTAHASNTVLAAYFRKYLFQKAISVFKFTMPDTWDDAYFKYLLYGYGYLCVINTDRYGPVFSQCGFEGVNLYYQPTHCIINNPVIKQHGPFQIGKQCALVKLMPNYSSIVDIVSYYADLMALASETMSTNLINSKLAYVFAAGSTQAANSMKKLYDQIASGETAVFLDKTLFREDGSPNWQFFSQNLGQNYIAPNILADMRKIEAMFDTDIGIPNANTDKRERLVTDEVNSNNAETASKASLWLDSIRKGFDMANGLFGLKLSATWRYDPMQKEGVSNVRKPISDGAL